jgi:hypothetical protein
MSNRNVVHVEIPAKDVKAAGKFYQRLFGWKISHEEALNYALWEPVEGPGGGFPQVDEEYKVGEILIHIASDDIDADLSMVEQLGGKVLKPKTEIPGIGWYGVFQDPTGNQLALYTSMNPNPNQ